MNARTTVAACVGLVAAAAAPVQAGRPYRFGNAVPITDAGDRRPVPIPRTRAVEGARGESLFGSAARYPPAGLSETWRISRAGDVNALDDVPTSSWFTPRLGSREMSPDEVLARDASVAPPGLPLTVEQVFPDPDGGLLATDAVGKAWFLDFDPRGHGGLQTTAGVLANRIFWAFGLNVPEDQVIAVRSDDLTTPGTDAGIRSALDTLLSHAAEPVDGRWRARASRRLEGTPVGPFSPRGVRIDDPNDLVPHENRRTLRALRVLGAFVNLQEIRPANTLDVYEGEADRGHLRHYLLDLGQAFGGSAAGPRHYWSGYNHYFSLGDALRNLVTAGFFVGPWEDETPTAWPSVGTFDARRFDPSSWRETSAFTPIRRSRPEDDYWAAKRLTAFRPEHIEALVRSVGLPDPGAAEYLVRTLLERQRKLVEWAFSRVTPLEAIDVVGSDLRLRDLGREAWGSAVSAEYRITIFDGENHNLRATSITSGEAEGEVNVPLGALPPGSRDGYLRVEVLAVRGGREAPRPAEFHLRYGRDAELRLVGVVH